LGYLPSGPCGDYNGAMQPAHDAYCDGNHPPRQRCNRALFPADPVESVDAGTNGAFAAAPVALEDERVDAQREAIAETEVPEPTAYAAREWRSTVAALEEPAYLASEREHAVEATVNRGAPLLKNALVVGGGIALVALLWSLRRPRKAEAPERE
jgi:hypothetical protein